MRSRRASRYSVAWLNSYNFKGDYRECQQVKFEFEFFTRVTRTHVQWTLDFGLGLTRLARLSCTSFWRQFSGVTGCRARDLESLRMAASERMSEYELARQERIKENQKMLEELFPEGTTDLIPPKPKRRHTDANSLGSGSDCVSETSHSDEEGCLLTTKAKHRNQLRCWLNKISMHQM